MPTPQQPLPLREVPSRLREKPVLIVEDSPTSRELLETLLRSWSIPVVSVASAEEGLARLEQHNGAPESEPFGLVILDWMLPGMSGLDAAARIRSRDRDPRAPDHRDERLRRQGGGEALCRAPRQRLPAQADDGLVAVRRDRRVAGRPGACGAYVDSIGRSNGNSTVCRSLLAEDNEANQMVATELLGRLGIALDIAGNGREAIAMAQAAPAKYTAILMDMQMPELDGLAATRALRADPRFATMPIIAMTANAMKVDLDACLAAGMNDHITKPIDRRALLADAAALAAGAEGRNRRGGRERSHSALPLAAIGPVDEHAGAGVRPGARRDRRPRHDAASRDRPCQPRADPAAICRWTARDTGRLARGGDSAR